MFSGLTSASLRTWVAGLQRELPHPACGQGVEDTAPGEAAQPCQTTTSVPSRPLCQPMGGSLRKIEHTYLTAHPDSCTVLLLCYSLNIWAQRSSVSTFRHLSLAECTLSSFFGAKTAYILRKVLERTLIFRSCIILPVTKRQEVSFTNCSSDDPSRCVCFGTLQFLGSHLACRWNWLLWLPSNLTF